MKGTIVFNTTNEAQLMGLINDIHKHYIVTDIQYSTYVTSEDVAHYTACVTYIKED